MPKRSKAGRKAFDMTSDPFDFDSTDLEVYVTEMEISPNMDIDCAICIGTHKSDDSTVYAYVRTMKQGGVAVAYRMNVPEEYTGHRLRKRLAEDGIVSNLLGRQPPKEKDEKKNGLRGDVVFAKDITLFSDIERFGDTLQLNHTWKLIQGDTSGTVSGSMTRKGRSRKGANAEPKDQTSAKITDSTAPSNYLHRVVAKLGGKFSERCYCLNEHGAKVFLGDKKDAYAVYMRKKLSHPYWHLNERMFRKWINAGPLRRPALGAIRHKSAAVIRPEVQDDSVSGDETGPKSDSDSGTETDSNSGKQGQKASGASDGMKVNGKRDKSQKPKAGNKRKAEPDIEQMKKRAREDTGVNGRMVRELLYELGISDI